MGFPFLLGCETCSMPGLSGLSSGRVSTCSGTRRQPARGMSSQCRSTASARCSSVGFFWPGGQRRAWTTGTGTAKHPGPPPLLRGAELPHHPLGTLCPSASTSSLHLLSLSLQKVQMPIQFSLSEPIPCPLTMFYSSPSPLLACLPLSWAHVFWNTTLISHCLGMHFHG